MFGGNAATYGVMQSVYGVGMLASSVAIALLGRFNYKGKLLTVGAFVAPTMMMLFAVMPRLGVSLVVLFIMGLAFTPVLVLAGVLLQILVPDALRGRVMSMFTLMNFGMQMLGGLFLGMAAQNLGVQVTVLVSALILLAVACAVFIFAPAVRALE